MPHRRLPRAAAGVGLLVLCWVLYALSNLVPAGQAWENHLLRAHTADGMFPALLGREIPFPPFDADIPTLAVGTVLAVALAVVRRRWSTGMVVLVATPGAVVASQLFKDVFGRPDLIGAVLDRDVSYPSGHASIAFAVTAALLITMPLRWLRWAAPVLLGWSALAAAALQSVGYHRPSEVLGAGLLTAAVLLLVGAVLPARPGPVFALPQVPRPGLAVIGLAAVAVLGAWNSLPWAIALYAAVALVSIAIVGAAVVVLRAPEAPPNRVKSGLEEAARRASAARTPA